MPGQAVHDLHPRTLRASRGPRPMRNPGAGHSLSGMDTSEPHDPNCLSPAPRCRASHASSRGRRPRARSPVARPAGALLVALLLPTACAPPPADVVISDVRVVDVDAGQVTGPATVILRDGLIETIATGDDAQAATDTPAAQRLEGEGGYLIPGLWDMHVHFRGGEELADDNRALLPLYVANGVTTVRDGGGDLTPAVLEWRDRISSGELVGPRILTSGPKLDGPTGGWEGSIRLIAPSQVPAALDSLDALGADYIKIYDGTTPADVYLEIIREAERRDRIVTGHMPFSVDFRESVRAGLDATEHLYYAYKGGAANEDSITARERSDDPLGFWQALDVLEWDDERAAETWALMAEYGTAAVPTLHIGRVLSWVDQEDHTSDPELAFIPPAIEETYAGRVRSARASSPAARESRRALQEHFIGMVGPMHAAGVPILAGSDAGPFNSYVYPGFSLHDELAELAGAGLSNADVLRIATLGAATFMRRADELGSVGEGFRGDLVLLGSNPLDDIAATRDLRAVVLDGRTVLDRDALDALLDEARR